jgi:hypothetical protein
MHKCRLDKNHRLPEGDMGLLILLEQNPILVADHGSLRTKQRLKHEGQGSGSLFCRGWTGWCFLVVAQRPGGSLRLRSAHLHNRIGQQEGQENMHYHTAAALSHIRTMSMDKCEELKAHSTWCSSASTLWNFEGDEIESREGAQLWPAVRTRPPPTLVGETRARGSAQIVFWNEVLRYFGPRMKVERLLNETAVVAVPALWSMPRKISTAILHSRD